MRAVALGMLLLLAACGKGPAVDLPTVKQMRTVAAEWAMVNELAQRGQLTSIYAEQMRQAARQQLVKNVAKVRPDSPEAAILFGLLAEPADAAPQHLRSQADKLKSIETALESA